MEAQGEPRLSIKQIEIGPMANYTYIVADRIERKAMLVDPAWDISALLAELDEEDLELSGALITHHHPDHIGGDFMGQHIEGLAELLSARPCKFYVHQADAPSYLQRHLGPSVADLLVAVADEATLEIGCVPVRVLHTPGHSPDSQCFLVGGNLVSGDTLFVGSCGRVDLPGSDPSALYYSLTEKLKTLPDDTVLLPGHNYGSELTSTIGKEKRFNPYMRFKSLDDYLRAMGY